MNTSPVFVFRQKYGLTQSEAGEKLGISQSYVAQLEAGIKQVSAALAVAIEKRSGGEIPRESLRPDLFSKAAA